jgi:hypothetical protein
MFKKLPPVTATPQLSVVAGHFERPWIDFKASVGGRFHHPGENMPDYGAGMALSIGEAALMLNLNFTDQQKETLLVRLVQYGIDIWGVCKSGFGGWNMDGGHGPGRKLPILLAGVVLGDQEMADIGKHNITDPVFGEDQVTYYLYRSEVARWIGGDGKYPSNNEQRDLADAYYAESTYTATDLTKMAIDDWTMGADYCQDDMIKADNSYYFCKARHTGSAANRPGTGADWGTYWRLAEQGHYRGIPEYGKEYYGGAPLGGYQGRWISARRGASYRENWGWPVHEIVLAAHIMGLKEAWRHDALFDYTDRLVGLGWGSHSYFSQFMWKAYRADCGPIWPDISTAIRQAKPWPLFTASGTADRYLYDNTGKLVRRLPPAANPALKNIPSGVYYKVTNSGKQSVVEKIVVLK